MADGFVPVHNSCTMVYGNNNEFTARMELVQKLQGGVIIEVSDAEEAKIAEEAGACSFVVYHGTPRMPSPDLIKEIKQAVSIPIMARVRVGHFVEAQILEAIGVDCVDESELLGIADSDNYINKHSFCVPFACGCKCFEEALMRLTEGATIIWMQGGRSRWGSSRPDSIAETVRIVRSVMMKVRNLTNADENEVFTFAKKMAVPYDLVAQIRQIGRLPALQFAAGGIGTPADAALMMQLGCDGVFVGSEIFSCSDPYKQVQAIVQAVKHYNDPHVLAESSSGLEDTESEDDGGFIAYLV